MPAIEVENLPPSKKKKTVNRISRHDWNIKVRKIETLHLWNGVEWHGIAAAMIWNGLERSGVERDEMVHLNGMHGMKGRNPVD